MYALIVAYWPRRFRASPIRSDFIWIEFSTAFLFDGNIVISELRAFFGLIRANVGKNYSGLIGGRTFFSVKDK